MCVATARSMHPVHDRRWFCRILDVMLWMFRREEQALTVEVRFDEAAGDLVMTVTRAGKPAEVERYATCEAFSGRVTALRKELASEGWRQELPAAIGPVFPRFRARES